MFTKDQISKMFGCSIERLNEQYAENAKTFERMYEKAIKTGKKVNGYTAVQLKQMVEKYKGLAK